MHLQVTYDHPISCNEIANSIATLKDPTTPLEDNHHEQMTRYLVPTSSIVRTSLKSLQVCLC
jgi:hypothetical protein